MLWFSVLSSAGHPPLEAARPPSLPSGSPRCPQRHAHERRHPRALSAQSLDRPEVGSAAGSVRTGGNYAPPLSHRSTRTAHVAAKGTPSWSPTRVLDPTR